MTTPRQELLAHLPRQRLDSFLQISEKTKIMVKPKTTMLRFRCSNQDLIVDHENNESHLNPND
eukprot:CAMPEP_0204890402 /NCGR_PEP_ID=MMETSP1349-20130617/25086_1 /ASSEMBLY_ACC=CAM_ASM_000710 /TAXON_ID=215587 /ORGANISM="Aplanochytrium stocchinoi, Strain GSBS06" /LENGTH=62 /DNA_ID=CAMNT_0052055125 /DNA_START=735 /DNA_END=923 /DNA_ORIENTATION=+